MKKHTATLFIDDTLEVEATFDDEKRRVGILLSDKTSSKSH